MIPSAIHMLRGLQALFAIIVLGLDAYGTCRDIEKCSKADSILVADFFNSSKFLIPCPGSIAFLVFAAVYTLLIVIPYTVLAPRYFGKLANKWAMLSAEMTTMLFWFGGFVASADLIRKLEVCRGVSLFQCNRRNCAGFFRVVSRLLLRVSIY